MLRPTVAELPVSLGTYGRGAEQTDGPGRLEHLFHRSPFTAAFDVAGMPVMSVPLACEPATGLCRRAPAGAWASPGGARWRPGVTAVRHRVVVLRPAHRAALAEAAA